MKKFFKDITASNKGIKEARARLILDDVENAQQLLITDLKTQKRELTRKIMNLEDLSGDSVMSLNPVKADFNAADWVKELQSASVELETIDVQLEIALKTFDKYFKDEDEKTEE